jgi:hypothetical protein
MVKEVSLNGFKAHVRAFESWTLLLFFFFLPVRSAHTLVLGLGIEQTRVMAQWLTHAVYLSLGKTMSRVQFSQDAFFFFFSPCCRLGSCSRVEIEMRFGAAAPATKAKSISASASESAPKIVSLCVFRCAEWIMSRTAANRNPFRRGCSRKRFRFRRRARASSDRVPPSFCSPFSPLLLSFPLQEIEQTNKTIRVTTPPPPHDADSFCTGRSHFSFSFFLPTTRFFFNNNPFTTAIPSP